MSKEDIAAKMKVLVRQYHSSGQSRKVFASAHGISEAKLTYWIKKLSKSAPKHKKSPPASGFVPLKVEPFPLDARDGLLIRLPSGVEIQIPV